MVLVFGTRFVALSVLVVLVVPALTMFAPADAQSPGVASGNLVIPDPVGDAAPIVGGLLPETPASAAYGHVDITRLEIGNEEAASFEIILGMVGFGDPTQVATQAAALSDFRCMIYWTYVHDGAGEYNYRVEFGAQDLFREPGSDPGAPELDWSWSYWDDGKYNNGYASGDEWPGTLTWDDAGSAFVIKMPKAWAPVWPGGHPPAVGDVLQARLAYCWTDVLLFGHVSDYVEASDANGRYAFKSGGSRSSLLHLGFIQAEGGTVGAEPLTWQPPAGDGSSSQVSSIASDVPTKVPVYVSNQADSRKLVQLTVVFEDPASANGWNVSVTPSIMVPANDLRKVNLIVNPPPGVALGATLPIRIEAKATGEPMATVAPTTLRVTPLLSAENNKFYLHSREMGSWFPLSDVAAEVEPYHQVRASLLEVEPGFDDEPAPLGMQGWTYGSHRVDPLVRPVRLDTLEPVRIALGFEGDASKMVDVEMYLMANDDQVFAVSQRVPGDGVTEIEAIIPGEGHLEFDVGTELHFRMYLSNAGIGPQTVQHTSFLAKQSHFILPVASGGADYVLTDGRFLPSLALAKDEESSTYVNPGKEYAFDLVLSNDGIETDDLRLSVNATNATGWDVDLKPGKTFRVQPGNSTPFALVVNAPEDAAEGQRAIFDVTAQSKHDPRVHTQVRLEVIVTTGVVLDGKPYEAKDGQLDPLEEERADAPGAPAAWVILALVGVAMLGRRGPRRASE